MSSSTGANMATFGLLTVLQGLAGCCLFFGLYYIHWELTLGASRRAIIKKHGCKPVKDDPVLQSFPNKIIGIKIIKENVKALREHCLQPLIRDRFWRIGNTHHQKALFKDFIQTIEPENLKTILAVNFKQWEIPTRRKRAFVPLLGDGIFTTDGGAWQHSRELLRPNFVRSQVGDLATFEIHVDQMLRAIPRDGSTVDLQDLFFQLTMDSATEFLFGESTNYLSSESKGGSNIKFADAFNHSQEHIARTLQAGRHDPTRSKAFVEDAKYCQDFVDHFVRKGLEYRKKTFDLEKADTKTQDRYVFLQELVKHTADPIQIRSELLNILLAGRDSTASLLSDVFFVLARRPDVWAKLRAEVDELGGQRPTFQQLKDMKYLRFVLNECKNSPLRVSASTNDFPQSSTFVPCRSRQRPNGCC